MQGLCLTQDYTPLGLRKGDRLDPTPSLPDIGNFFELCCCPVDVTFWRPDRATLARHRNPLFSLATGITPYRCLTTDLLHAFYLGIVKQLACTCFWFLIQSGLWGPPGGTEEERLERAREALVIRLFQWYRARHQLHPEERLTRVNAITSKMLGSMSAKELKTKGAESWGVLLFTLDMLATNEHRLGDASVQLVKAGRCLEELVTIWQASGIAVSEDVIDRCWALWEQFLDHTHDMELLQRPKRHVVSHLISRLADHGNPRLAANWFDEALNKLLKAACRQVSQTTFEASLTHRMRPMLGQRKRQRE